ncbi:MAG: DUF2147 domain-containing protein [Pseudomonadota bacterium]
MKKNILVFAAASLMMAGSALADPIVGNWRTGEGGNTKIAQCGSSFCVSVTAGEFAGQQIGTFSKDGDKYKGSITDPADGKKYRGAAWFTGSNTLKMRGSVLGGLVGRTDTWTRR